MFQFSAVARLWMALACSTPGILLAANLMGLTPDVEQSIWESRSALLLLSCAAVALLSIGWFLRTTTTQPDTRDMLPNGLRDALDYLSEALIVVGPDRRIQLANKAAERATGYGHHRMVGIEVSDLPFRRREGGAADIEAPWEVALRDNSSVADVMMDLAVEGQPLRMYRVRCAALTGADRQLCGVAVTFSDFTVREQHQDELHSAQEKAEAAQAARHDFLVHLSREVCDPMNSIMGFADVLRRGLQPSAAGRRDCLDQIHARGAQLVGLINDLQDLSDLESGKVQTELRLCRPAELIVEVIKVLQPQAQQRELSLEVHIHGRIPRQIQSDPDRLRQILMTLVRHAIQSTPPGSVRIEAELIQTAAGAVMQFSVIDTGVGLTPDQTANIFAASVHDQHSSLRHLRNTGPGLATSRKLAEALGGTMQVSSHPDECTTFTFTVATGCLNDVELVDEITMLRSATIEDASGHDATTLRFQPARVLVADDDASNRQLLSLLLTRCGLTVVEAEHGLHAIEQAISDPFDLIVMDRQMPVMDGLVATRKLREMKNNAPILAVDADAGISNREAWAAAGCTTFIPKPVDIDQLLLAVAEVLVISQPDSQSASSRHSAEYPPAEDPLEKRLRQVQSETAAIGSVQYELNVVDQPKGRASAVSPAAPVQSVDDVLKQVDQTLGRPDPTGEAASVCGRTGAATVARVDPAAMPVEESDNGSRSGGADHSSASQVNDSPPLMAAASESSSTGVAHEEVVEPLYSALPLEIPEFHEIVRQFVDGLPSTMQAMRTSWKARDFETLRGLAHKLKGTGGTVGFADFTAPSQQLQVAAGNHEEAGIEELLVTLETLSSRVRLPEPVTV